MYELVTPGNTYEIEDKRQALETFWRLPVPVSFYYNGKLAGIRAPNVTIRPFVMTGDNEIICQWMLYDYWRKDILEVL